MDPEALRNQRNAIIQVLEEHYRGRTTVTWPEEGKPFEVYFDRENLPTAQDLTNLDYYFRACGVQIDQERILRCQIQKVWLVPFQVEKLPPRKKVRAREIDRGSRPESPLYKQHKR